MNRYIPILPISTEIGVIKPEEDGFIDPFEGITGQSLGITGQQIGIIGGDGGSSI